MQTGSLGPFYSIYKCHTMCVMRIFCAWRGSILESVILSRRRKRMQYVSMFHIVVYPGPHIK